MNNHLNIEDQECLSNNCGDCSVELTDANRSGWFAFYGEVGDIQIELCTSCSNTRHEDKERLSKSPLDNYMLEMLNMTEAGFDAELDNGVELEKKLAMHLHRMKAGRTSSEYTIEGKTYKVTVELI